MAAYLGLDLLTVVKINVIIQTIAYLFLIVGFNFARKKNFNKHKIMMVIATLLIFVSLAIVMLPSFYSIVSGIPIATINFFTSIIIFHHSLGVITLIMAALVLLRPCVWIEKFWKRRYYMIVLFIFWSITYFLGIFIYYSLYH